MVKCKGLQIPKTVSSNLTRYSKIRKCGRAVYGSGLENQRIERYREFESHRFRQIASLTQLVECFAYTEDVGGSSPSGCTTNVVSSVNSLGGLINISLRVNLRVIVE